MKREEFARFTQWVDTHKVGVILAFWFVVWMLGVVWMCLTR